MVMEPMTGGECEQGSGICGRGLLKLEEIS